MAFTNTNDWITGRITMRTPSGSEVCSQRFEIALGTGDLALNTAGQIGWLPPGCVPVNYGGIVCQQCGSAWYMPQGTQFVVVNPRY